MSTTSSLTINSTLPIPNSQPALTIPRLGFGSYLSPPEVTKKSCTTALEAGYRHIDTAQYYANETQVGEAVASSGLSRSEIYLTTKILAAGGSVEKSYQKCLESIKKLDPSPNGYVDLFLIHSPNAGREAREEMWLALNKLHAEGKAKAIGVSNFGIGHIERLEGLAPVWPPQVNQIELHPWFQQKEIVTYCTQKDIIVQAYCPIVRNQKAYDETVVSLSQKYSKTVSQILIRWSLQRGWVPLPKSDSPERIVQNMEVFDFDIDAGDMEVLDALDEGAAGSIVQVVDNK